MKNTILIDIDTDRTENQLTFSKPDSFPIPTNETERREFVITDLKTLTYGLASFIRVAAEQGIGNKALLLDEAIKILKDGNEKE